jgi:hypothetical protein
MHGRQMHDANVTGSAGISNLTRLCSVCLLASALDESAEIPDWEVKREVDRGEQLHEEEIPPQQTNHEGETTSRVLEVVCENTLRSLEEEAGETAEGRHQQREDEQEDDVRAKRADHVHEAQHTHIHLEVGEGGREDGVAGAGGRVAGVVGDGGVVEGGKSRAEGKPEGAK